SFRLEGGAWVASHETPPDGELRAEYESSTMAIGYPDLKKAPESIASKLSEDYGYDDWRELGRNDALIAYSEETPVGIIVFRRPSGKWEAADTPTGEYSDSSTSLQLRGHYEESEYSPVGVSA